MSRDKHLTADPLDRIAVPGMAHFPGGGPAGRHCIDCEDLVTIQRGRRKCYDCCAAFQRMRSDSGAPIGKLAANRACKYFVEKNAKNNAYPLLAHEG